VTRDTVSPGVVISPGLFLLVSSEGDWPNMEEQLVAQLLTLLLATMAVIVSLSKVWISKLDTRNKQESGGVQIRVLRQEIQHMREKVDAQTRKLVNEVMQRCLDDNRQLQERIREIEAEREALQAEVVSLREQLEETRQEFQQRIGELEGIIRQKEAQIARLESRLVGFK
jgi:uncharacterized protein involved in exopolysaccharide biosynthesis